jgi:gas vesicle protein
MNYQYPYDQSALFSSHPIGTIESRFPPVRKEKNNMAADDCVKGLIIGGLIGVALGILYAPKSGKETREEISHSADELLKKTQAQYEEICNKIEKLADQEKELLLRKKEKIKKVLEAGAEVLK